VPMFVRRGFPVHPSKASYQLQVLARDSALPGSTKSVIMLPLMELTSLSVCFTLIQFLQPYYLILELRIRFISAPCANTNELPLQTMQKSLIVITPKGSVEANYMTHRLTLTNVGRKFWSTPLVLEEISIDLILCMSWLRKAKAVIHCAKGTVELTSSKGERFEVGITITASTRPAVYLVDGKFVGSNIRVVRDFPDVFPEVLPRMPLDREVEFVIDLLPGTTHISKRPY
jgi:hypothetical protein